MVGAAAGGIAISASASTLGDGGGVTTPPVVLGGVGQLAGTVYAALGLGVLNKLLEGWQGAVLAKIMVLVFIILFIQKRPQGLFAMKGRAVES